MMSKNSLNLKPGMLCVVVSGTWCADFDIDEAVAANDRLKLENCKIRVLSTSETMVVAKVGIRNVTGLLTKNAQLVCVAYSNITDFQQ